LRSGSGGGRGTDDGHKYSSGFDHLPGALQGVATNHIEDHINTVDHLLEARGGVVDDLVGPHPQFAQEVAIARRGGRDDLRPRPMSKLDSKDSNASRASMDQDGLPRSEVRVVKQAVNAESGTAAACTWSSVLGLGTSSLGRAMV